LAFSGFSILLLSFFLFGFKESRKLRFLISVLTAFFVMWSIVSWDYPYFWDIYPFLISVLLLLALVRKLRIHPLILISVGVAITSIPFWQLEGVFVLPAWLEPALWGWCAGNSGLGDWPILPWIGYPLFAYGCGRLAQKNRLSLARLARAELGVWMLLLLATLPLLGKYYVTPSGNQFACHVFRVPPLEFWAHQLWILFGLRLSLLTRVEEHLQNWTWARWISQRAVNRRFFLVYFAHYPLCLVFARLSDVLGLTFYGITWVAAFFAILLSLDYLPVVFTWIFGDNVGKAKRGFLWQ
jgi:hypothetical protein